MSSKENGLAFELGRAQGAGNISKEDVEKFTKLGKLSAQGNGDASRLAEILLYGQDLPADFEELQKRVDGATPEEREPKEVAEGTNSASIGQGVTHLMGQGYTLTPPEVPEEAASKSSSGPSADQMKIGPGAPTEKEDNSPKAKQGVQTTKTAAPTTPPAKPTPAAPGART